MNLGAFSTIAVAGFSVAFFHAAIPTHWLPFVAAARAQKWSKGKTLLTTALCGSGHVLFTTALGALIVGLGIKLLDRVGAYFPWVAGGALATFGLYYVVKQWRGQGHGHHHLFAGHRHNHDHDSHIHAGDGRGHTHVDPHDPNDLRFKRLRPLSPAEVGETSVRKPLAKSRRKRQPTSDWAAFTSLFLLLTFSPCEGFLPVYVSGIEFGWAGFALLSSILAVATVGGMVTFTWLTLAGLERLKLDVFEKYESGIMGALLLALGVLIIAFET